MSEYNDTYWVQNEDYPHLNDKSEVTVSGGVLTLSCNDHSVSRPVTGDLKWDELATAELKAYTVNPDDDCAFDDWAEALGLTVAEAEDSGD